MFSASCRSFLFQVGHIQTTQTIQAIQRVLLWKIMPGALSQVPGYVQQVGSCYDGLIGIMVAKKLVLAVVMGAVRKELLFFVRHALAFCPSEA
jgi:hypothetical protein